MERTRRRSLLIVSALAHALVGCGDDGATDAAAAGASGGGGHGATGGSSVSSASSATSATTGTGGQGGAPASASGTIVPLYTYPSDPSWNTVAKTHMAHPTVATRAVINPNSGPGAALDAEYATGIEMLDQAGVEVLGYVATTYAARPAAEVEGEIDVYIGWYPQIRGIFFDEMSNTAGDEGYYASLTRYVKSKGLTVTVGNPGQDSLPSFVGAVDTILVYESAGLPDVASLGGWHLQYDPSSFGVIPYAVDALDVSFVTEARASIGFVYLTDDDLPNPWDSLPPYYDALLDALE